MKRRLILVFAFVATVALALVAGTNIINALERQSYTATYSMQVGGQTRSWEVIAPVDALPRSAPIIVMLAGKAEPIDGEVQRDRFVPLVNAGKAEMVYPVPFHESWNAGDCCGDAARQDIDDMAFIKALVRQVDPGRARPIFVVGYSNGGRLAYRLACDAPGLFNGTAVVKATPTQKCLTMRPLNILQVAARDDTFVPYRPGDPGREKPAATVLVGRLRHIDGCANQAVATPYTGLTITTWSECKAGSRVQFAVWEHGGHNFAPPTEQTPGASSVIFAFFTKTAIEPLPR